MTTARTMPLALSAQMPKVTKRNQRFKLEDSRHCSFIGLTEPTPGSHPQHFRRSLDPLRLREIPGTASNLYFLKKKAWCDEFVSPNKCIRDFFLRENLSAALFTSGHSQSSPISNPPGLILVHQRERSLSTGTNL